MNESFQTNAIVNNNDFVIDGSQLTNDGLTDRITYDNKTVNLVGEEPV
jgi:hypothetical protein